MSKSDMLVGSPIKSFIEKVRTEEYRNKMINKKYAEKILRSNEHYSKVAKEFSEN